MVNIFNIAFIVSAMIMCNKIVLNFILTAVSWSDHAWWGERRYEHHVSCCIEKISWDNILILQYCLQAAINWQRYANPSYTQHFSDLSSYRVCQEEEMWRVSSLLCGPELNVAKYFTKYLLRKSSDQQPVNVPKIAADFTIIATVLIWLACGVSVAFKQV